MAGEGSIVWIQRLDQSWSSSCGRATTSEDRPPALAARLGRQYRSHQVIGRGPPRLWLDSPQRSVTVDGWLHTSSRVPACFGPLIMLSGHEVAADYFHPELQCGRITTSTIVHASAAGRLLLVQTACVVYAESSCWKFAGDPKSLK